MAHIDAVLEHGELANYYWRIPPVQICTAGSAGRPRLVLSYGKALALARQERSAGFLARRLEELK